MKDIAERAGVSVNTVSLALRNSPRISTKTRRRIQKLAKTMGYRPNPMVAALFHEMNSRRSDSCSATIAVLDTFLHDRREGSLAVVQRVVDSFAARLDAAGYGIDEFDGSEWVEKPREFLKTLRARGIQGLFFLHFSQAHTQLDWDLSDFAMATVNYSLEWPNIHRANVNQWRAMELALTEAHARGYRRPGLVLDAEADDKSHGQWTSSLYHFQLHHLRAEDRIPPFLNWGSAEAKQSLEFSNWLKAHKPDVVLTMQGRVRDYLTAHSLRIPEDLGFIHLNQGGDPRPSAAIDINPEGVGHAAADLIAGQLTRNERGIPDEPRIILVPPKWVDGPTVRERPSL